jgi:effector-binding domain-containing protein
MANLILIGRFSKMTRLSIKALRRYDGLGLLVPAVVDPSSSYRYYTYWQANRAEAIRILRRLDMPLEQIRELLESEDAQVAAKLLQMHRGRLEDELERHRRKLAFNDVIDEEGGGDIEVAAPVAVAFEDTADVRGEELPATTVAWTVHRGPFDEVGPAYHTVAGWIQEHGHEVAGPPREVYLTDPDETPDEADYLTEVQFPIR